MNGAWPCVARRARGGSGRGLAGSGAGGRGEAGSAGSDWAARREGACPRRPAGGACAALCVRPGRLRGCCRGAAAAASLPPSAPAAGEHGPGPRPPPSPRIPGTAGPGGLLPGAGTPWGPPPAGPRRPRQTKSGPERCRRRRRAKPRPPPAAPARPRFRIPPGRKGAGPGAPPGERLGCSGFFFFPLLLASRKRSRLSCPRCRSFRELRHGGDTGGCWVCRAQVAGSPPGVARASAGGPPGLCWAPQALRGRGWWGRHPPEGWGAWCQGLALAVQGTGLCWWKSESWAVGAPGGAVAPVSVLAVLASQNHDLLVQKGIAPIAMRSEV